MLAWICGLVHSFKTITILHIIPVTRPNSMPQNKHNMNVPRVNTKSNSEMYRKR